ncbi:MAG: LCP family protein [Lachnospiraceae bacterium]
MDDKEKNEIDFDPTQSEGFYKNLDMAIQPEEEPEKEKWEPTVEEEDAPWIAISETEETAEAITAEAEPSGETAGETEKETETPEEPEAADTELPELNLSDDLFRVEDEEDSFQEKEPADEMLLGINAALAEQIEHEFGKDAFAEKKEPGKFKKFLNGIPTWTKVLVSIMFALILGCILLFGTSGGQKLITRVAVEFIFSKINVVDPDDPELNEIDLTGIPEDPEDPEDNPPVVTQDPDATPVPTLPPPTGGVVEDDSVINILLLGEENMYHAKRGRTDAILVASIDKDGGPLKLISFMRDLYVRIPISDTESIDDRLNAAYTYGGVNLLIKTMKENFGIDIHGYVLVEFEGFENIIDQLGGLRISLTAEESEYLNTTKYISKPEERNTKPGLQTLTGSQVLGFCRVRKVPTANGKTGDFGRTYRQRMVLEAIFNKYKEKNLAELLSVMNSCFGYVTAPADMKEIAAECLQIVIENKMFELETMQMPPSKHFNEVDIRGMKVITYYPDCVDILHEFIYENEE